MSLLSELTVGTEAQVVALKSDRYTQERLRSIGFGRGRIFTLIKADKNAPLLIQFFGTDSRVGISKELSEHIQVKAVIVNEH